jgi:hypothetical protein
MSYKDRKRINTKVIEKKSFINVSNVLRLTYKFSVLGLLTLVTTMLTHESALVLCLLFFLLDQFLNS